MRKLLIFGNFASGKTTLARQIANTERLGYLDLDRVAWKKDSDWRRSSLEQSSHYIADFTSLHRNGWVIEGNYADLLELICPAANEMIFLDVPAAQCLANIASKPPAPTSAEFPDRQQIRDLICRYHDRDNHNHCSRHAHDRLFENFGGHKQRVCHDTQYPLCC